MMHVDAASRPEPDGAHGKVLVAFQTHVFGWQVKRVFQAISRALPRHFEAVVLVHLPPGAPEPPLLRTVPHLVVRTPEIRVAEYARKSGLNQPDWAIWTGGHTDLPMMCLARAKPGYAYYWGIEYDVRYTGSWRNFFERYNDSDADFVGAGIRDSSKHPNWFWWNTLVVPDGVSPPAGSRLLCSFMPVYRVSARLIHAVDQAYRAGWSGHSEVVWPTLAHRLGMPIIDLGGQGAYVRPQDRGQVYICNVHAWGLGPGTFVYKPLKHICWQRNMLWHPVKPIGPTLQEDYARLRGKLRTVAKKGARALSAWRPALRGEAEPGERAR